MTATIIETQVIKVYTIKKTEAPADYPEIKDFDRKSVAKRIKQALRARSGKPWSVTVGSGSVFGWLYIRADPWDDMTAEQRTELAGLLGLDRMHHEGLCIPASDAYYTEYIDRAEGRTPRKLGITTAN